MRTLRLIRHSLTEGNERHLYYGWTELPLTEGGRALCERLRGAFDLPEDTVFGHSGMLRAEETLRLLFGPEGARVYPALREMDMGALELRGYEELKDDAAFCAWCEDTTGDMRIPGGTESVNSFRRRIMAGVEALLADEETDRLLVVCHGGTIAHAMQALFPESGRSFYDWIPGPCAGYALAVDNGRAVAWTPIPCANRTDTVAQQ